jgi:hypothetical protein
MRKLIISAAVLITVPIVAVLFISCSHPIVIVGNGDVRSESGERDCLREDFLSNADNCNKNYVIHGYTETYYAEPRPGWQFDRWVNYCTNASSNECSFNVPAETVHQFWGETMPPLQAMFKIVDDAEVDIRVSGEEETVFDWTTDRCETEDIPDLPARAFRDAQGNIQLVVTHYTNRKMTGSDFDALARECDVIMPSHQDPDPAKFNDREWISAVYTTDGSNIHALVHNEYQGSSHAGMCPSGDYSSCWYNAITYASSNDMGDSYTHASAPNHLVASVPYIYVPDEGPYGIFEGSNIVHNIQDGFYYKLLHLETRGEQQWGTGVMRTQSLSDPASWRCWDGQGFNASFVNPYTESGFDHAEHVCAPVSRDNIVKMSSSVTFNTFLGKFLLVGVTGLHDPDTGQLVHGVYFSLSEDLIDWSPRKLIFEAKLWWTPEIPGDPIHYPSIIDPGDQSLNFEYSGQNVYLYFTRWHSGTDYDRDLIRVPLEIRVQ